MARIVAHTELHTIRPVFPVVVCSAHISVGNAMGFFNLEALFAESRSWSFFLWVKVPITPHPPQPTISTAHCSLSFLLTAHRSLFTVFKSSSANSVT